MNNVDRVIKAKAMTEQGLGHALLMLDELVHAMSLDNSLTVEGEKVVHAFLDESRNLIDFLQGEVYAEKREG